MPTTHAHTQTPQILHNVARLCEAAPTFIFKTYHHEPGDFSCLTGDGNNDVQLIAVWATRLAIHHVPRWDEPDNRLITRFDLTTPHAWGDIKKYFHDEDIETIMARSFIALRKDLLLSDLEKRIVLAIYFRVSARENHC